MIEFVLPGFEYLRPYLKHAGLEVGNFTLGRFPNQEITVTVKSDVKSKKCFVIGTIAPPESNLLEFTLLAHTLKNEGASNVVAVLPYLAYARQDKASHGESLGLALVGQILAASGIDEIISVEIHSDLYKDLVPIPAVSISPAQLMAGSIQEVHSPRTTVIAPDEGAIARAKQYATAAGIGQFAYLEKVRVDGVRHLKLVGETTESVVIIDDILDTGRTLISAAELLVEKGVKDIYVAVAHALFTGQDWQELWNLNVRKIYCLDTIPAVADMHGFNTKVISCGPLLAKRFAKGKFK